MAQRQIIVHRTCPKETHIQNSIIWDGEISTAARFYLIAMLSLPDSWDYSVRGMAALLKVSKDTMGKYIKELEQAGYLKRQQSCDENGRFSSTQYVLTDMPGNFGEVKPCNNFSDTVLPDPENSPQKKRTEQWKRTEEKNAPYSPPKGDAPAKKRRVRTPKAAPDWKPERFEGFWRAYPVKKSKQAAIRAWDSLRPDDALLAVMGKALKRQLTGEDWQRGFGIPYPATWLNGRRWEDEDKPSVAVPPTASALPAPSAPRPHHTEIINGEEVMVYDDSSS